MKSWLEAIGAKFALLVEREKTNLNLSVVRIAGDESLYSQSAGFLRGVSLPHVLDHQL